MKRKHFKNFLNKANQINKMKSVLKILNSNLIDLKPFTLEKEGSLTFDFLRLLFFLNRYSAGNGAGNSLKNGNFT